jgi:cyclopropane-fatty-acyl-phospholipid synthase
MFLLVCHVRQRVGLFRSRSATETRLPDSTGAVGWGLLGSSISDVVGAALQNKLVKEHGVKLAVGLTLSENQAEWIRSMGLPSVEVRVESWSDHVPIAAYDSIISIGAFEHFARPCSRTMRVKGNRNFFERCYGWLNPGGWMSLHSIGLGAADRGTEAQFVAENIFPESDLPRLGEIADASEGIFEIVSVRNDRADYMRTNHEFRDRLRKE